MTDTTQRSRFSQFLAEMRRRHVGRFALGYAASAFVLLQLAEIIFPAFGIGDNGLRVVVAVATLGFPPALVLAWMYDLTRSGITRTEVGASSPWLRTAAVGSLLVITVLAAAGAGLYLTRQGVFATAVEERGPPQPVTIASFDPAEPIRSIAVLPLQDNSPGDDEAYFAASMHEELIAKLSQLEEIRVVSRTSTMQFADSVPPMPEIARRLGVDVLVEGSVVRTPQRTRVTLQLIHGPSDSHIQTLQWDREEIPDVLAFQTEVAHEVVEAVAARHEEEPFATVASEVDPDAQEAYFRGRYAYDRGTPEGYRTALTFFQEALTEDPDFAPALAGLAGARFLGALEDETISQDELMLAYAEADSALAMDSTSMETREVFALIEGSLPRFMEAPPAPDAFTAVGSVHVVRLPGREDSIVIDMTGFDTAWVAPMTSMGERIEAQVRRQTETVTQNETGRLARDGRRLIGAGRFENAERVLRSAVTVSPENDEAWDLLLRSHVTREDLEGALDVASEWAAAGGMAAPDATDVAELDNAIGAEGDRGYWRWRADRLEAAASAGTPVRAFDLASTYAALSDEDQALEHLERALRDGEPAVMTIRTDPVWDDLRSSPRLREIVREAQRLRLNAPRGGRPPGG
ncbi:MAG: hypothetical protein HKN72_17345 [Gemmatimonadetes bacterium]|nr:hypothetical protein [Gemmatimonadota bacterium]